MLCKIADLFTEIPEEGGIAPLLEEYKTDDFFQKYMHNHFSSIEEIKEKYPELK